ncbi:CDGSH iron-sulfur domain-containing protein [Thermomicrobium sp. 4228-Ro]|uniref:CDGSH iron-sulfur domain-containing protein n=1 Tax=Thermomicrobium sp. 4228-Ro TaxID=2993937 RepID=UPI002248EF0D|nr:CDGSH iron-sulfur domain-containing protein [Thermomicrobium sp. 4228-Ro]MCX2727856.1 CDGSH iron-sulfur domain-containing protein [Thermomicrobium sp. 4228-Ro]
MSEVRITVRKNGPYHVQGRVVLVDHEGNEIPYEGDEIWLCRCGGSAKKPFCDGTHKRIGFQGDLGAEVRRRMEAASQPEPEAATSGMAERTTAPDEYVAVRPLAEVPEAQLVRFEVDGEPRILVRFGDRLYAIHGICTHEEAELAEGDLEDGVVYCPLHGSGFELATGRVTSLPATRPLPVYDVVVREGVVYVSRRPRQP